MNEKDSRECLFKEAEIVQDIIARMANNSFQAKGWSVTLVVASLLLSGIFPFHLIAFVPWAIFWTYDAYFLRLEKLYRTHYDWLIINRLKDDSCILDLDRKRLEAKYKGSLLCLSQTACSKILIAFYGVLGALIVLAIIIDVFHPFSISLI